MAIESVLPRLYERDIDVLLQEELIFNPHVRALFSKELKLPNPIAITQCSLSVVDESGETDLSALFYSGSKQGILLIENKIDAAFQPQQPERYKQRAERHSSVTTLNFSYCVLVAPLRFIQSKEREFEHFFDAAIPYESIASAIALEATERASHRATLLLRAVEQARTPYVFVPSEDVSILWKRIFDIANSEFPILKMKSPGNKGSYSNWITFKADLPPSITIDWKISKGTVDLSFWNGARHKPAEEIDLSRIRSTSRLGHVGTTVVIQAHGPKAPTKWSEVSDDQIREALQTARELLEFYKTNPTNFA